MGEVTTIGIDLAKNVFQVHGVDAAGEVVFHRQLRLGQVLPVLRKQPACLVGIEVCATAHHWAREIGALSGRRRAQQVGNMRRPRQARLLKRRPTKVSAIALANKIARIAWAMMARGTTYREPVEQAA